MPARYYRSEKSVFTGMVLTNVPCLFVRRGCRIDHSLVERTAQPLPEPQRHRLGRYSQAPAHICRDGACRYLVSPRAIGLMSPKSTSAPEAHGKTLQQHNRTSLSSPTWTSAMLSVNLGPASPHAMPPMSSHTTRRPLCLSRTGRRPPLTGHMSKASHRATRTDMMRSSTILPSRTVLHQLAHIAMHADIVNCQIFASAKRLLGRTIGPQELNAAQRRIRDLWAPSEPETLSSMLWSF